MTHSDVSTICGSAGVKTVIVKGFCLQRTLYFRCKFEKKIVNLAVLQNCSFWETESRATFTYGVQCALISPDCSSSCACDSLKADLRPFLVARIFESWGRIQITIVPPPPPPPPVTSWSPAPLGLTSSSKPNNVRTKRKAGWVHFGLYTFYNCFTGSSPARRLI